MVLTEHILSRFLPSVENVSNSMMNASCHPLQSWRPPSLSSPCPWTYPRCWSSGPEKKRAFPLAMLGDVTAESAPNPNPDWIFKTESRILTWVGRGLCITPLRMFFPQVARWLNHCIQVFAHKSSPHWGLPWWGHQKSQTVPYFSSTSLSTFPAWLFFIAHIAA